MEEHGEGVEDQIEKELTTVEEDGDTEMETDEEGSEESDEGSEEDDEEGESGEEEEEDEDEEDWESASESSESETEDEAMEGDDKNNNDKSKQKLTTQTSSGSSQPNLDDISDLSDGETERCPVCLSRFVGQKIGVPETCDHAFCLECILEWSKNMNTCPKDRQVYHLILVKNDSDGPVIKQVKIEDKQLVEEVPAEEDNTCCEVCGRSDHEDRLLLCDGCDLAFHCECLEPPLRRVPIGEWFCPDCAAFGVADAVQEPEPVRTRTPRHRREEPDFSHLRRLIPRTLAAERVRTRIQEIRSVGGRRRIVSDSEDEEIGEDNAADDPDAPSTSAPARKRTTMPKKRTIRKRRKTRKRKTKRKTPKKKTTATGTSSTSEKSKTTKRKTRKRRKVRRKKGKRKGRVRTLRATPKSVKTRLAETLGLKSPGAGRTIPTVRSNSGSGSFMADRNREYGQSSLTILGDRDDLDPFAGSSDEEMPTSSSAGASGGTAVAQRRARVSHFSRASMKSCSVIRPRIPTARREASSQVEPSATTSSTTGGFDLLGNILMGQSLLHLKSDQVTIRRDGSLLHNSRPEIKTPTAASKNDGMLSGFRQARMRRSAMGDNNSNNSPSDSPRSGGGSSGSSGNSSPSGRQHADHGHNAAGGGSSPGGHSGDNAGGSSGGGGMDNNMEGAHSTTRDHNQEDAQFSSADEQSDNDKGADSDSGNNHSDDNGRRSPTEKVTSSSNTLHSDKNTNNKGSKEYDPASPSESQDGVEIPSPTLVHNESDEIKNDKTEEYDPFAPTSDPEDKSEEGQKEAEHSEKEDNNEENKEDKGSSDSEQEQIDDEEHDHRRERHKYSDDEDDRSREAKSVKSDEDEQDELEEKDERRSDREDDEEEERDRSRSDNEDNEDDLQPESPIGSDAVAEELLEEDDRDQEEMEDSDDDSHKVPISELPRIPKKRKETTENDLEQPTRSVLERASRNDKQDQFPRWEKRERAYRERDRGDRDRGDRDRDRDRDGEKSERSSSRKHKKDRTQEVQAIIIEEEEPSESPRSRRRRRKRRDHDKEEKVERTATTEYDSGGEEVIIVSSTTTTSSSSRHKHKKRSRSRSKERRRERERRERSRSHERERSSRRRHERTSRSHSRDREEKTSSSRKKKKDRGADSPDRPDRKHRRRSRSRSPHHRERDRDHREKEGRDSERSRERRSNAEVFKGSVKMFSQSLKEASDVENTGRRFKLKRNFYQGSENQDPSKKYRYEEAESSYERRHERPEVKSAVVKPVAVQELYDSSDDGDCEIIRVEYKGKKSSSRKQRDSAAPPAPPPPQTTPSVNSLAGNSGSKSDRIDITSDGSSPPPVSRAPAPPSVPTHKTPQKPETKVTFKLPDKSKKSSPLVKKKKLDIFESDDEEDYDPFDPTESSSPQRPKEPASPKSDGESSKDGKLEDNPPEPAPEKDSDESQKRQDSPKQPPSEKESIPDQPKPPKTPPLPAAPAPPAEPPGQPMVRIAAPPPELPPTAVVSSSHGVRLANAAQNMVLQHVGLPVLQPGMSLSPSGRPVLMNHMMVNGPPPPPFNPMAQFPPGRMWPPNVIIRQGLAPGLAQNGGPPEHIRFDHPPPNLPGMRPGMPPPPPPGMPTMGDKVDLATPPPPLPHKALAEMEQISQLLNARVGKPRHLLDSQDIINLQRGRKDSGLFKVPMPPPPLPGREGRGDGKSGTDLDVEVVDMDVASPLSDDENIVSFSPPPLDDDKPGRRGGDKDDDVPTSAVELDKRQKYMKKLNRQERVVEEVKLAIKPHYSRGKIDKEEYKEILRKAVPKICHSKSGDINSAKIRTLIAAYVDKMRKVRKYEARKSDGPSQSAGAASSTSSSKANGQKRRK